MPLADNLKFQLRAIYRHARPKPNIEHLAGIFGIEIEEVKAILDGPEPEINWAKIYECEGGTE